MNARTTDTQLIGTTLDGRFRITELFSSGGMSVLYKGVDTTDHGVVAIRMMHAHRTVERDAVKRFEHGLKAIALLKHPNIVPALASGVSEDGRPFIVTPFIAGISLREEISKNGNLTPEQGIPVIEQIAAALQYAHEQGIVHRNIKPGNIILFDENGRKHAYLTGFGIAKQIDGTYQALGVLTQTNKVVGSPRYMSPEQFMNKQLDPRSDIYSFGCVCYELFKGTPPFTVPSALEMASKHLLQYPERISAQVPDFPPYLDDIVSAALLKKPEDRYQSADALRADLKNQSCRIDVEGLRRKAPSGSAASAAAATVAISNPLKKAGLILLFCLLIAFILSIAAHGLWFIPKQPTDYLGRPI